jgi:hypothetical protein
MKKRKFSEGGYADSDDAKNLLEAEEREKKEYERSQMSDEPGTTESIKDFVARTNKPAAPKATAPKATAPKAKPKAAAPKVTDTGDETSRLAKRGTASKAADATPKRMTPAEKLRNLRASLPEQKRADIKPDAAPEKGSPLDKARRLVRGLRVPERTSYKSGGSVSASRRADGCATKGKTKGKMV